MPPRSASCGPRWKGLAIECLRFRDLHRKADKIINEYTKHHFNLHQQQSSFLFHFFYYFYYFAISRDSFTIP